jgi:hypothetical protein
MARALIYYQEALAGYLSETDEGFLFEYDAAYLELPDSYSLTTRKSLA